MNEVNNSINKTADNQIKNCGCKNKSENKFYLKVKDEEEKEEHRGIDPLVIIIIVAILLIIPFMSRTRPSPAFICYPKR